MQPCNSQLATRNSQLATRNSQLATRNSQLVLVLVLVLVLEKTVLNEPISDREKPDVVSFSPECIAHSHTTVFKSERQHLSCSWPAEYLSLVETKLISGSEADSETRMFE